MKGKNNSKLLNSNYLLNSYNNIIKHKIIHFIIIVIDVLLIILEELNVFINNFNIGNTEENSNKLSLIPLITIKFVKLSKSVRIIILLFIIIIFDSIYIFVKHNNFLKYNIYISIFVNILDLLYFRLFSLVFLNLLFSFNNNELVFICAIVIFHSYFVFNHFLYNHLYYYVPTFINYPYDEFSSLFDIILFIIKILLSICSSSNNSNIKKFMFLIIFFQMIIFSLYFVNKLLNHSFLFMKNSFLNRTRFMVFIFNSEIIIISLIIGKNEIMNIYFFIVGCCLFLINIVYIYFVYNPFRYIVIKMDTPEENMYYYLYILSEKNNFNFLILNKLEEHHGKCGLCNLCKRFYKYLEIDKTTNKSIDDEKQTLLDENEFNNNIINKNNKLFDIFHIIYDGHNQYFNLVINIILNYKKNFTEFFQNISHYFVNLSILIINDFEKNKINLALNEQLILKAMMKENASSLENHNSYINILLLSNEFINLSYKIINKIKDIFNEEQNMSKAKQIIDLSSLLKKLKNKKYKKYLFTKSEKHINSQNIISACSIFYEEIFNISINKSQQPLRENILSLEEIFRDNNKSSKIISLCLNLDNKYCNIIRAGKDLYSFINYNLFDLFPLEFKQYQIDYFLSSISSHYDKMKIINNNGIEEEKYTDIKNEKSSLINKNHKNKREYIEIKLIFNQTNSSKIYYKLLILKIYPLLTNENNNYILFEGIFNINNNIIITLMDHEKEDKDEEKILSVSTINYEAFNLNLDVNLFPIKKYILYQNKNDILISKIFSFNISLKLFSVYEMTSKEKEKKKFSEHYISLIKDSTVIDKSNKKNTQLEKVIDENASQASVQTFNSINNEITTIAQKNKKKDNTYINKTFDRINIMTYVIIILLLIFLIIEVVHLKYLESKIINFNESFIKYRKFAKYYFQLFPLTLSLVCIEEDSSGCKSLLSYYKEEYEKNYENENYDITLLIKVQRERIHSKLMEKTTTLTLLYEIFGAELYHNIFRKSLNFLNIKQSVVNNYYQYDKTLATNNFYDAIYIMISSFQTIFSEDEISSFIVPLNKTDQPFSYINSLQKKTEFTKSQIEIYKLILNYNIYDNYFILINDEMKNIIFKASETFKIYMLIYIHLDILLLFSLSSLVFFYIIFFENIIVKLINYIYASFNNRTDDFDFSGMFFKKLDNLEIILKLYAGSPVKAIKNINIIYSKYYKYILKKNKNETKELSSKAYAKLDKEKNKSEMDNIPKNQRIVNLSQIKNMNLVNKYIYANFFIIITSIILYASLLIKWLNYFQKRRHFLLFIDKNTKLEDSAFRIINIYYLMIFNNFTLNEINQNIYNNNYDPLLIIQSFYQNLKFSYEIEKEKEELINLYESFETKSNFSCKTLYKKNSEFLEEIGETESSKKLKKIKDKFQQYCQNIRIEESCSSKSVFERHFQYTINGIINLTDFTYEGLIKHLKNKNLGDATFFFNNIIVFLCEIIFHKPNKKTIRNVLAILHQKIIETEISVIIIVIISSLIIIFFVIRKIKKHYEEIFLLKYTFQITEIQID